METTELLERAWKNKESGDIDAAWKDVYQALVQLRNDLAAQPSAQRTTPGGSDCPHGYAKRFDCPDCNPR
jgi:hypothetical protein